jgi:hypothetical protein
MFVKIVLNFFEIKPHFNVLQRLAGGLRLILANHNLSKWPIILSKVLCKFPYIYSISDSSSIENRSLQLALHNFHHPLKWHWIIIICDRFLALLLCTTFTKTRNDCKNSRTRYHRNRFSWLNAPRVNFPLIKWHSEIVFIQIATRHRNNSIACFA